MKTTLNPPLLALFLPLCLLLFCGRAAADPAHAPVDWVNPYIGNVSYILAVTHPMTFLPKGMLRVYPNRPNAASPTVSGLQLFHAGPYFKPAFNLSPVVGADRAAASTATYHTDLEKITPYQSSVFLKEDGIIAQFAPAAKAAVYTFDYDSSSKPRFVVVNAKYGRLTASGDTVTGYADLGAARAYLYLEFSAAPTQAAAVGKGTLDDTKFSADGDDAALALAFPSNTPRLAVRYGVSYISVEQAKRNLDEEVPGFDLGKVAERARQVWNDTLGTIQVSGGTSDERTVFYTALYRTNERMIAVSEDGRYFSGFDRNVHPDGGVPAYTDDAIWDEYRAAHPLDALIHPEQEAAEVQSYIRQAQQSPDGWMPTTPMIRGDDHVMNGNHFAVTLWDSYTHHLPGIDYAAGYASLKKTILGATMAPWTRAPAGPLDLFYQTHGYFPALPPGAKETLSPLNGFERRQAVAVTLETCYDDWCMARLAQAMGKPADSRYFLRRSYNYRNLYNPATGFFHPKDADGHFIEPFDYGLAGGLGGRDYYDENNGWTYRWDVPHNIGDLVALMGGPARFCANLDATFTASLGESADAFHAQFPDSTGNIGQFAMGNEPSMTIPYLYNYAGQPWKTQQIVRQCLSKWFRNDLRGYPGDEDHGGLSSFAVFSMIGFYPVMPGTGAYSIGSPVFSQSVLALGGGKQLVIRAVNASDTNLYVQSALLNGKAWRKPWFPRSAFAHGGTLTLIMGPHPNKAWGASPADVPPSAGPPPLAWPAGSDSPG